ncbi:MAG: SMP-30/gluconolactonase/LRE family protein [Mycobacteriales bacterium]|nr:MAG: gluconolaconase [Pseudonocardiales bacterium]
METFEAELLGGPRCELGEGPIWNAATGELVWVDILGKAMHRAPLSADGALGEVRTNAVPAHLGAVVPVASGGYLLAMGQGFAHLADDGGVTPLAQPEAASEGANRMNDAKCDAHGRWFAGSMAYSNAPGAGTLYRVELDGEVTSVLTDQTIPNGLGWNTDGTTMYLNDSGAQTLTAYDFDLETGDLAGPRVLVRAGDGSTPPDGTPPHGTMPDGLTTDDAGTIWTAWWDGGIVRHYDAAGELLTQVRVPVRRSSSCCFAGPDRDLLVITTGVTDGLDEPDAGRLFLARPGVTGPAAVPFAGELPTAR